MKQTVLVTTDNEIFPLGPGRWFILIDVDENVTITDVDLELKKNLALWARCAENSKAKLEENQKEEGK